MTTLKRTVLSILRTTLALNAQELKRVSVDPSEVIVHCKDSLENVISVKLDGYREEVFLRVGTDSIGIYTSVHDSNNMCRGYRFWDTIIGKRTEVLVQLVYELSELQFNRRDLI